MADHDVREILPGLWHWTSHHDGIGTRVSSYLVEPAGLVLDPLMPDGGLDALAGRPAPQQVVMTTGLHDRDVAAFAQAYGAKVRAPREARDRLGDGLDFEPFGDGEELAPGVRAIHVGALAPDEYALHLDLEGGVLAFADGLIRYAETLQFVPDELMGDDPETVKAGLRDALRGLLERDFDHLVFAHGEPLIGGGKAALRDFLA